MPIKCDSCRKEREPVHELIMNAWTGLFDNYARANICGECSKKLGLPKSVKRLLRLAITQKARQR